jgi:hypothetical protein
MVRRENYTPLIVVVDSTRSPFFPGEKVMGPTSYNGAYFFTTTNKQRLISEKSVAPCVSAVHDVSEQWSLPEHSGSDLGNRQVFEPRIKTLVGGCNMLLATVSKYAALSELPLLSKWSRNTVEVYSRQIAVTRPVILT